MPEQALRDRCILITGGSRGISAAIARELAAQGARLALLARDTAELASVAAGIAEQVGRAPFYCNCDVRDADAVHASVHEAIGAMGGLQGVVNNAGINEPMRPFLSLTREEFRDVFDVNLFGAAEVLRASLPYMLDQSNGAIVNIASMAGKMGVATWSAYCSSKHALLGFTKVIAREVAASGITCNAICPGFVHTNMVSHERLEEWAAELGTTAREVTRDFVYKQTPQRRYVAAESIASMTAYLLSSRAADITGQAINVSCGIGDY